MTLPQPSAEPPVAKASTPAHSSFSDGEWHRMHPMSPLMRGGLFVLAVIGFVVVNLRDRLVEIFLPAVLPDFGDYPDPDDALDLLLERDLLLIAALVVLGIAFVVVGVFWLVWRAHTYRITDDDVEVRSGVLFRTYRRAPLDRVQGVNLVRPFVARLIGLAKLEVVGAGADGNVRLEYLATRVAEAVRADILQLASGRQRRAMPDGNSGAGDGAGVGDGVGGARAAGSDMGGARQRVHAAVGTLSSGMHEIVDGAEEAVAEPESVVHIPAGRIAASRLLSGGTIALIVFIVGISIAATRDMPWLLLTGIPAIIAFVAIWIRSITRALRYGIAPTPDGVRITFGLLTTTTEILPPGRVHAIEVRQPLLWRPSGWWQIKVNRLSGGGENSGQSVADVLPVGTVNDVHRVLALLLPNLTEHQRDLVFVRGLQAPKGHGAYATTPRRARGLRPLSWRRNGYALSGSMLFFRRGAIWRSVALFPLERMQSIGMSQGPLDRALNIAGLQVHTIGGPVSSTLGILDRDDALAAFAATRERAITASASDHSHRWAVAPRVEPDEEHTAGEDHTARENHTADEEHTAEEDLTAEPQRDFAHREGPHES